MLSALFEVILPVVLVASVGVVLGRVFDLDGDTLGKVNLYGFTPFLAFDSLMKSEVSLDEAFWLVTAYLAVGVVLAGISFAVTAGLPGSTRRGVTGAAIIGNNGNFGLPIALLALGQAGLDQAVVIFLTSLVVMFTVGPMLLGASGGGLLGPLLTLAKLPVIWAMLLAVALRIGGWTPPVGITRGTELLASGAVPLILLALGVQLAQSRTVRLSRPIVSAVVLRVLLSPLLAFAAGLVLPLSTLAWQSLLLACAMPTAVNAFMLAREYGSDPETAASAVALSTLGSIVTLTLVISWLPALG